MSAVDLDGAARRVIRRVGPPRTAGIAVAVRDDALQALCDAAAQRSDRFQAAILLGEVARERSAHPVEIRGFSDLAVYDDPQHFLAESLADWQQTRNRLRRVHADLQVLGWASLRPGSCGLLHRDEERVHRTFFNLPWQLTLTIDPQSERIGLFGADRESLLVSVGFNLVEPAHLSTSTEDATP